MSTLLLLLRSGTDFTQSITDNAGSTDSLTTASAFSYTAQDVNGASDSTSSATAHFFTVTDNTGNADGLGFSTPTDLLGLTDAVLFSVSKVFSDNAGGLDTNASSSGRGGFPSDDLETLTDTQTFVKNIVTAFLDAAGTSDNLAFTFVTSITDSVGLTDPFITPHIFNQAATDSAGMTDLFSFTLNAVRAITVTDDAGATDSVLPTGAHFFTVTDALAGTDSVSAAFARILSVTDAAGVSDTVATLYTPPTAWTQSITDSAGTADNSSARSDFALTLTDLGGSSDTNSLLYLKTWLVQVDDGMALADSPATVTDFHVQIDDNIGLDTLVARSQNRVNSGRTIQMVEYVQRMQD